MKYQEAMLVWTPPLSPGNRPDATAGKLMVVPFGSDGPIPSGAGREFMKSMGACDAAVARLRSDQIVAKVLADFVHLVRDEGMDPARVHRAFMEIDEYRDMYLAEPLMGDARPDDSDPRVAWQGGEIVVADLPTWDEAVAEIVQTVSRASDNNDSDRLKTALLEAIADDVKQGRLPRGEVHGLRLGIVFAGLSSLDETLSVAATAAKALRGED